MLDRVRQLKKEASGAKQLGFTIIEVMIVLAIAGLIMVIVFVAIPQLQRNTRNTTMKDVVNRIKTEPDNYSSNNNGKYPTTAAEFGNTAAGATPAAGVGFTGRYLGSVGINDPKAGTPVALNITAAAAFPAAAPVPAAIPADGSSRQVSYYYYADRGAKCNGEVIAAGNGARNYAIAVSLEGGAVYCVDNQ